MLFEPIPAYLEFSGFPATSPEELRAVADIRDQRAVVASVAIRL
jgi:shikimate dehydrogenase